MYLIWQVPVSCSFKTRQVYSILYIIRSLGLYNLCQKEVINYLMFPVCDVVPLFLLQMCYV